jgi:hypothetical protein
MQSLRTLADETWHAHQLLSFYLKGRDRWQMDEYLRKGQEIRAKGLA